MSVLLNTLWDDNRALKMSESELLLYRSNLLGSDLRITNFGGGNTSAKIFSPDPLSGDPVEVLWVKGSGDDLGSMHQDGFATLYLDRLLRLRALYKGLDHEDEMVGYLPHCTFDLNPRAASIDTPLHAFIPHAHIDHMHPDSVIAIACAKNSQALTKEIYGDRLGWLPWQRPGFDLGLKLGDMARENPDLEGVILQGHGLFSWADTSKACYERTLDIINISAQWLAQNDDQKSFGGPLVSTALDTAARQEIAAALMPVIRGKISETQAKIGHFTDAPEVLTFVNSAQLAPLAAIGTSCPDHFLRTKIRPLVLDFDPANTAPAKIINHCLQTLDQRLDAYRDAYAAYYKRCAHANSPAMRDGNAVVYLLPGIGMMTFAANKATARIAAEFYINAINVMRGAQSAGGYVGLPEQEAFDIEYWLLEEAKLQRLPKPKRLAGKTAFITGAAGGIGAATARRLLQDGACVMLADIDQAALDACAQDLANDFSNDVVATTLCDVTKEDAVRQAFAETCTTFGGVDILVSNAGIASSAPLDETSLDLWNRNIDVLTTGYFLVAREAYMVMKKQARGGSIIFISSKNALVASANAAAYCTAKAAEVHLARSIALEGAPLGIRCNVVNPDAVLHGSKIWSGDWKKERAAAYAIDADKLEEHYRQRSLLKRNVLPQDIAEAVAFFATERSAKSTGNIINVDAGHAPAFTR